MSEEDGTSQATAAPPDDGQEAAESAPKKPGVATLATALVIVAVILVGWRLGQQRKQAAAIQAGQATLGPGPSAGPGMGGGGQGGPGMGGGPGGGGGGWTPPTPEERAKRFDQMCTELGVDATQKAAIQKIYDESMKQTQALRDKPEMSQEDRRAEMLKLREERTEKVKALLTDEQKTKYDELTARRRGGGQGGPGGPGMGGGPAGQGGGPGAEGGAPGSERGPRPEGAAPGGDRGPRPEGAAPAGDAGAPATEAPPAETKTAPAAN